MRSPTLAMRLSARTIGACDSASDSPMAATSVVHSIREAPMVTPASETRKYVSGNLMIGSLPSRAHPSAIGNVAQYP